MLLQISMLIPIAYMIFWAVLLCFSLYSEPVVCGLGMVIMLTGVPVYFVGVYWKNKPRALYRLVGEWLCDGAAAHFVRSTTPPWQDDRLLFSSVFQKKLRTLARRYFTWCFLRKTLQRLNPSQPPKLLTEQRAQLKPCYSSNCTFSYCYGFFFLSVCKWWRNGNKWHRCSLNWAPSVNELNVYIYHYCPYILHTVTVLSQSEFFVIFIIVIISCYLLQELQPLHAFYLYNSFDSVTLTLHLVQRALWSMCLDTIRANINESNILQYCSTWTVQYFNITAFDSTFSVITQQQ